MVGVGSTMHMGFPAEKVIQHIEDVPPGSTPWR